MKIDCFLKKKNILAINILGILLILPSLLPLFRNSFFRMHDYTHVARLYEMDKAIKDGHFPVRWSKDLGWGYGMPLFNFYAPLPYYFAEVFHLLGFNYLNSIKICFGSTFFIGFIGMYLLAKKFWGKLGAWLAAIAFVYSPYRAVDFYVRGALGELFAISLIPFVIWGITLVIEHKVEKKRNRIFISSKECLAGLMIGLFMLGHTVLNLICFPFFILFSIFYLIFKKASRQTIFRLTFSFLLGLGLAAFFILPAFMEKKFVQTSALISGYSHYSHHFLYFRQFLEGRWGYGGSVDGINDGTSFHLGKGHLLLTLMTVFLGGFFIIRNKKLDKKLSLIFFFVCSIILLAFLSTYHAQFIWDAFPIMSYIQFPWRFNSLIIVLIAFLTGGGCYYLAKINPKIALGVLITSLLLIIKINLHYFQPQTYLNPDEYYYTDEQKIKKNMSGIIPDYIPIWVKEEPSEIAQADFQVLSGNPSIEKIVSKTQLTSLNASSSNDWEIQFNSFYYPGWQLLLDNNTINFSYLDNNGLIKAEIPKGDHQLTLKFKSTAIRLTGNLLSLFSLIILGGLFVYQKKDN